MRWRAVVGWEGYYEVSDHGQVRRSGHPTRRTYVGRILKQQFSKKGYPTVAMSREGCLVRRQVHQLVAAAFIGPRPGKQQVNHKSGIKTDNHYKNLEYATCKQNIQHAIKNDLRAFYGGGMNGCAKITEDDVRAIRKACASGVSQREAGEPYGLTQANVSSIVLFKTWKHVTG